MEKLFIPAREFKSHRLPLSRFFPFGIEADLRVGNIAVVFAGDFSDDLLFEPRERSKWIDASRREDKTALQ